MKLKTIKFANCKRLSMILEKVLEHEVKLINTSVLILSTVMIEVK